MTIPEELALRARLQDAARSWAITDPAEYVHYKWQSEYAERPWLENRLFFYRTLRGDCLSESFTDACRSIDQLVEQFRKKCFMSSGSGHREIWQELDTGNLDNYRVERKTYAGFLWLAGAVCELTGNLGSAEAYYRRYLNHVSQDEIILEDIKRVQAYLQLKLLEEREAVLQTQNKPSFLQRLLGLVLKS